MRFNMLYCFLNSDIKERKYSTLFEALTKCYTPLGESPLWLPSVEPSVAGVVQAAAVFKTSHELVMFIMFVKSK